MKIVEIKGSIAEDGSIIPPPGVLERIGMSIGDTAHLAYLSHHPVKQLNSYGEFFITKDVFDSIGLHFYIAVDSRSVCSYSFFSLLDIACLSIMRKKAVYLYVFQYISFG